MGFFEQIGQSITNAGQTTIQKTKEFSDITKINSQVSDLEKQLNVKYMELGRMYFADHEKDADAKYATAIGDIRAAEDKIVDLRHQIIMIKGVVSCPACGAENPNGATFCVACGKAIPIQSPQGAGDMIKCTKCGTMVPIGNRFCSNCGNTMEDVKPVVAEAAPVQPQAEESAPAAVEPEAPAAEEVQAEATEAKEAPAFCPECGAKLDGADTCPSCGAKVEA